MANKLALGLVIGGAVSATVGNAFKDVEGRIKKLEATGAKARVMQRQIGDTIRLRNEWKTAHDSGAAGASMLLTRLNATATTAPAINLLRIEENLSAAWQRLAGTYVENLPWLECAERYDRPHTFHYMDPPYWQTAGYGVDFPFENYERMADFMRRCKGKVMVSINDHPDIRRVFEGFHFETTEIRYTTTNQRQGKAEVTGELIVMNWEQEALGGLF